MQRWRFFQTIAKFIISVKAVDINGVQDLSIKLLYKNLPSGICGTLKSMVPFFLKLKGKIETGRYVCLEGFFKGQKWNRRLVLRALWTSHVVSLATRPDPSLIRMQIRAILRDVRFPSLRQQIAFSSASTLIITRGICP